MVKQFFTEEHQMIQETVRMFANDRLAPVVEKMDQEDYFPLDLFQELGELGLLAPTVSMDYEGAGADYVAQSIILEELGRVSPAFALSVGAHSNLLLDNLYRNSNQEQRKLYVPKLATGEWVGALALTEPDTGSDALGMRTIAVEDGDAYLISGSKTYITNSSIAKIAIVYAKTAPELKSKGITAFIMDLDSDGVSRGQPMSKMGMRGSLTGELFFDQVRVPKGNILGELNNGRQIVMSGLSVERAVLAAISLAISKTSLQIALNYSLEREQFGRPIAQFQLIQDKLARIYTETQASHLLVYWALIEIQDDHTKNKEAAASIMFASERSTQHALEAIQVLGGAGYMKEYQIERFMRDAKLLEIGAGTTEIRKLIIARELIKEKTG
ncbi:MAG: acyl-CoA dehydrogenase family protein [Candidatus Kariarchaeaceae archaeon]|jgi:isovaleryl-CoA dehydrogenase